MLNKPLLGALGVVLLALGWFYTANLQLKNDLQTAIIKQEAAEASLHTVEEQRDLADLQVRRFQEKLIQIENERKTALEQVNRMQKLFQDHDFANLLNKKPGLIENRMIAKTEEVFDEIETLTAN
jgi:hypothetical protein